MPVAPGGPYPQTEGLRKVSDLISEIADHSGGSNNPRIKQMAKTSLDDAVRFFNAVPWTFNRVLEDITLLNDTSEYDLAQNWRSPLRALLLDQNGNETSNVIRFVSFEERMAFFADRTAAVNQPFLYTARAISNIGKVLYHQRIGTVNVNRPKVRHLYHKRIVIPGVEDFFEVPQEVEVALFFRGVAFFLSKRKGPAHSDARAAFEMAREASAEVTREYRDWGEIEI